ncbi:MAG: hypothetical protein Kow0092_09810 [Deferrisomatales bacterium]
MATQGESLIRKTQKGLSILAFETTKQSRILKKRMRSAALQKEIKADLRDLGNLVYNAIINDQPGILEEEEVRILVENIRANKEEVEHLRDAIARLNRARKHFLPEEPEAAAGTAAGGEAAPAPEGEPPSEEPELEPAQEAQARAGEEPAQPAARKKPEAEAQADEQPAVPPPPGTDPAHPTEAPSEADKGGT